jgi:PEP-CTERM motif
VQAGGSGPAFANSGQTAYSLAVGLPDKPYATTLIGGASHVAAALLGTRDEVFGAAILGANYALDGGGKSHTYSASATFDFSYGGDLLLGLIDNLQNGFAGGLGFQSMEFYVVSDGSKILDVNLANLKVAESFFRDIVIDLGSYSGPVDLTFGYNLTAEGNGGFGLDLAVGGAVPEPSTWAMMLLGFVSLGYAGYRASSKSVTIAA